MPDPVRIEMSGEATAVVQAGSIVGGVHVHARHAAPSPSRPITGWHPFDLDVHRAVAVGGAGLPDLPAYLPREHDREPAAVLAAKRTAMVVLTGESSTGKTRALYEAVTAEPATWPLLHPRTAEYLLHVLANGVEPGTVLWLDETQNHLLDTHGERAAAALRTLLELPGPFVVVGTLWPQYRSTLTGPNQPQARALLHHRVTRIRVAKRFTAAQMAATPTDPRPAEAGHPPTERLLAALVDRDEDELAIKLAIGATAAESLVRVLVSKGKRARAIRLLRDGFIEPSERLVFHRQVLPADLLADEGRWDEALEPAKGEHRAQEWIPKRLALAGNLDKLRALADAGSGHAGKEPAALLAERGRHGELLDRTRRGDEHCAQRLVALAHEGKVPNGERLLAEGL
ncbi:hypothetical protein ACFXGA_26670 [Actinosynnema sp. NPDC059335]|uniref:hypothetical protein n=1 Tax=Actinosynnema sp. NPDC059335 TaxID=3346804 RepID=UPI00366C09CC